MKTMNEKNEHIYSLVALAEGFHKKIKTLYQADDAKVEWGEGGQEEICWEKYSKGWHRQHGPARWKNAGVYMQGSEAVIENYRGNIVATIQNVPTRLDYPPKNLLLASDIACRLSKNGKTAKRYALQQIGPKKDKVWKVVFSGMAIKTWYGWEHGATLADCEAERKHKEKIRWEKIEKAAEVTRLAEALAQVNPYAQVTVADIRATGACWSGIWSWARKHLDLDPSPINERTSVPVFVLQPLAHTNSYVQKGIEYALARHAQALLEQ